MVVGVKEWWGKDVNVAVPEARDNSHARAIDRADTGWRFDGTGGADGSDARIVDQGRAVVDRTPFRLGVDDGVREREIRGLAAGGEAEESEGGERRKTHAPLYVPRR